MNPCDFTVIQGGKRSDFYPNRTSGEKTDLSPIIIILIIIILMIGFQD
jgi:hypothetical protein